MQAVHRVKKMGDMVRAAVKSLDRLIIGAGRMRQ